MKGKRNGSVQCSGALIAAATSTAATGIGSAIATRVAARRFAAPKTIGISRRPAATAALAKTGAAVGVGPGLAGDVAAIGQVAKATENASHLSHHSA